MSVTLLSEEAKKKQKSQLLVLKRGQNQVMVQRHRSHNLMLDAAYKYFPGNSRDVVTLQTNELDVCEGQYVDITAEIWDDVIDLLNVIEVTRGEEMTSPVPLPLRVNARHVISLHDNQLARSRVNAQDSSKNNGKVTINLVSPSGEIQTTKISREMRVDKLIADACKTLGHPTDFMAVQSVGGGMGSVFMKEDRSISSYSVRDGSTISLQAKCRLGKKPVIYLYSPSDIDVSVKLSLIPEWSLSVIYPVVATEGHGQHLEWNVRTHQDGSLTEYNSGLDVSYLFWEAETNLPRSPASNPQLVDAFNPIFSSLHDMDSIVIPADTASVYLDKSLKVLGLHTEARTSFITYWLPSILKHDYIALRFLPQASYERAASLSISPHPDIVTRVFMLFRGIAEEHLAKWANAQMQAEEDVAWWVDVVGVDPARASDATLFRVLEWGGMEVLI